MGAEIKATGPDFNEGVAAEAFQKTNKVYGHVGGTPALLIRQNEKFFAIGAVCSHYGANLNDGIVVDGEVRCPWHHACFKLETGHAKAPALNPIPTWRTEIKAGLVFARELIEEKPRAKELEQSRFVIIGAGAAGHAAAETLRKNGFAGAIDLLSADVDLPYDRPNLSKDFLAGTAQPEWMPLRDETFYREKSISLRLNTRVSRLNAADKTVELADGGKLKFDRCLIATGGSPFRPPIQGIDMPHVHFLRSFSDCRNLIADLDGKKRAAIVGSGFIGLEAAAALRSRGLDVTIVSPDEIPLIRIVGKEVGSLLKAHHEQNGISFRVGSVGRIEAGAVIMNDGAKALADVVLIATGIRPRTELAQAAGLNCDDGIVVNEYLETSAPGIFAAGDIAQYPLFGSKDRIRTEHWVVAQRHGQTAALNMMDQKKSYDDIPFFWSQQFDLTFNYVGHAGKSAKAKLFGNLDKRDCAVAYLEGDLITAVLTIGRDRQSLEIENAFKHRDQNSVRKLLEG